MKTTFCNKSLLPFDDFQQKRGTTKDFQKGPDQYFAIK